MDKKPQPQINLIVERLMQGEFYAVTCKSGTQQLYSKEHLAVSEDDAIDLGKADCEECILTEPETEELQWTAERVTGL